MTRATGILPTLAGAVSLMALALFPGPGQAQEADAEAFHWIAVQIPQRDVYHRRDPIPVTYRADRDGYVMVMRVDTDGRIRMLYPSDPAGDNFVRGGQEYRVPNPYGYEVEHAFAVDDYPGVGYVFAVLSRDPFDFGPYVRNGHWDYRTMGVDGRITGDPYIALTEIAEDILPPYGSFGFDLAPYYVGAQFEYPRFVCYDCHAYTAYPVWDPYRHWCGTFKLVIYDQPGWYPATVYAPTAVVLSAGGIVHPQFVITGRTSTDPHMVHAPRPGSRDAPSEAGVRGRDLGGTGTVRTPTASRSGDGGGVGGLIRRLFGKDADSKRRPEPRSVAPTEPQGTPPTLERRKKDGNDEGASRRPSPNGAAPQRPAVNAAPRRTPAKPAGDRRGSSGSIRERR